MSITDAMTRITIYTDELMLQFYSEKPKETVEFFFLNDHKLSLFDSTGTTVVVNPSRCIAAAIEEVDE